MQQAYVAEWSKALDLRSIVHPYAQVRTLSYAYIILFWKNIYLFGETRFCRYVTLFCKRVVHQLS